MHSKKKINAVTGVTNAAARAYENVNGRMCSGELPATYPITNSLFSTFSTSYTRGTKDTEPANGITTSNIPEIHPVMGTAALRYDRSVFFGEIQGVFSGRHEYVDTDLGEEQMPPYGLLNLKVGAQKRDLRLTVALANVLNEQYVDHMSYQRDPFRSGVKVSEPGRNFYANVAFRF